LCGKFGAFRSGHDLDRPDSIESRIESQVGPSAARSDEGSRQARLNRGYKHHLDAVSAFQASSPCRRMVGEFPSFSPRSRSMKHDEQSLESNISASYVTSG